MTSLLNSIFGIGAPKQNKSTDSLFDRSIVVPPPRKRSTVTSVEEEPQESKDGSTVNDELREGNVLENGEADSFEQVKEKKPRKPKRKINSISESEKAIGEEDDHADGAENRTVFVGNLPLSTTRKSLAQLFLKCGAIESTRIRSVAVQGVKLPAAKAGNQNLVKKVCVNTGQLNTAAKQSVQGYVVFKSMESVAAALAMNNKQIPDPDSRQGTLSTRRLRVDHSKPTYDASRTVFVGNLPYSTDEDSLQQHFKSGCNLKNTTDVESVRIVRDPTTFQCRGFGYVLFADKSMASTALRRMNGTVYKKKELRVQVCGKRFKGKRGEQPPKRKERQTREMASAAALKRILTKQATAGPSKKRRARGDTNKKLANTRGRKAAKAGVSKREAAQAKTNKRVKKIEKRISKGMGKAKKK